jgi:hypothetical protein
MELELVVNKSYFTQSNEFQDASNQLSAHCWICNHSKSSVLHHICNNFYLHILPLSREFRAYQYIRWTLGDKMIHFIWGFRCPLIAGFLLHILTMARLDHFRCAVTWQAVCTMLMRENLWAPQWRSSHSLGILATYKLYYGPSSKRNNLAQSPDRPVV